MSSPFGEELADEFGVVDWGEREEFHPNYVKDYKRE